MIVWIAVKHPEEKPRGESLRIPEIRPMRARAALPVSPPSSSFRSWSWGEEEGGGGMG